MLDAAMHLPYPSFGYVAREGDVTVTFGQDLRGRNGSMTKPVSYKRHRFPPQIIAHAIWLHFRFPLSLRLVEEMMLERGIVVSYETVRRRATKFGPEPATAKSTTGRHPHQRQERRHS
jgi:hypothetical protein